MASFILKVLLAVFAVIKDIINRKSRENNRQSPSIIINCVSFLISIWVVLMVSLALVPFLIFRTFLLAILKLIHGRSFGGFLRGIDAIFEIDTQSTTITIVFIYKYGEDRENLVRLLKAFVETLHSSVQELRLSINRCCGYFYFVRDQVKAEDVLKIIELETRDGYLTRDTLHDYIENNCATIKENQMIKVSGFVQPILWNNNDGYYYPLIISVKHCIGDGPSIIGMFKKVFKDAIRKNEPAKINIKMPKETKLTLDNVYVHRNPLTSKLEGDLLTIEGYSKWHLVLHAESKPTYLTIVKKLKNKLNVKFVDVINTILCSSVLDYMNQRKADISNVTTYFVVRMNHEDLSKMLSGKYDSETMKNSFGFMSINVPFTVSERSMRTRILKMHRTNQSLMGGMDLTLSNVFAQNICSAIPIFMMRALCGKFLRGATVGITNVVGVQKSEWMGHEIEDIFFFIPNFFDLGFTFTIFTYDGKLEVALTSKRGYVRSREELESILDNAFEHIDRAKEEILLGEDAAANA